MKTITPGTWEAHRTTVPTRANKFDVTASPGGALVAWNMKGAADAALLAAAPELLEVLAYYVDIHERNLHAMPEGNENEGKEWRRILALAKAAIAKANTEPLTRQ